MSLRTSSFPIPETRFFKAGNFIFRFKIRGGTSYREKTNEKDEDFNQEMEDIIRTVIGNLDNLQPFCTNHYTIFPYKKCREVSKNNLQVFPHTIILYVEKNMEKEKPSEKRKKETQHVCSVSDEPRSKRCRRDSPLEEAILQDLIQDMAAEHSVTGKVDAGRQHEGEKVDPVFEEHTKTQDPGQQEVTPVRPGILKRMARLEQQHNEQCRNQMVFCTRVKKVKSEHSKVTLRPVEMVQ
ncbi:uncharacterized protein LOC121639956 isoform X2 [Melanotaenia boesemani]|uniref:uncharacterized protein LOC121639956 isoform X2 n=1 Tax=Melanotaenia boesemani TaxID=1250792 RepID=UPI001C04C120|nr:uncharacterized protein LOC121639956 isoform X2 [Melanotaenia boesemani]